MSTLTRWLVVGTGVSVGALVGVLVLLGFVVPPGAGAQPVRIALTIERNATSGLYEYSPATVHVPAGALVEFTITNYDPANHSVASTYCRVNGTFGGSMAYMMGAGGMGPGMMRSVGSLPPGAVSHTFTINQGTAELNIPIPPAAGPTAPSVVTFTWRTPGPGELAWECEAMGYEGLDGGAGSMMGHLYSA